MIFDLLTYIDVQRAWSRTVFGDGKRAEGICKHIGKELAEIRAEPESLEEWIDVIILALDGAWRAGYSEQEIAAAMLDKQLINMHRAWPKVTPEGEATEHIRQPVERKDK